MRWFSVALSIFISLLGVAYAAPGSVMPHSDPIITDLGGPDAYGYSWEDNDVGSGPTFQWVDITSIGEPIIALRDDNVIGPILFDFQFPYYWYLTDRCWIGSNGFISFLSSSNFAHPFDSIPSPAPPNDLVAVLAGDLDFTDPSFIRPPSCYFYTNHVDSAVISWINVSEFSANGEYRDSTHTFQLILSAGDSSLTFQYGENHGRFPGYGNLEDLIGIENVIGRTGIEYLEDNLPTSHLWHNGLAIKFHPEPNPNYVMHDIGVFDCFQDGSGANFIAVNSPFTPRVLVKNTGTRPENNMPIRCQIRRGTTIVYNVLDTLNRLEPREAIWVDFQPQFIPDQARTYRATFITTLEGDQNNGNNAKTGELDAYSLPQYLQYCDTTIDYCREIISDHSGYAIEYQLPDPIRLKAIDFFACDVYSTIPAAVWVLGAGMDGNPDPSRILAADTIMVNQTGWASLDLAPLNLVFPPDEKFSVTVLADQANSFGLGMDISVPQSYRSWEYSGSFLPDNQRGFYDFGIRIYADSAHIAPCPYFPGDINGDSVSTALDITYAVNYFRGGPAPQDICQCYPYGLLYTPGDVNGSCSFNGIDIVYYVNYLRSGPALRFCSHCPPQSR